jgi:archaemetzincin
MRKIFLFTFLLVSFAGLISGINFKKEKDQQRIKIALFPFKGVDPSYSSILKKEIEKFYSCDVSVYPEVSLPAFAYYEPRNRYKADSLLVYLKTKLPAGCNYILGITGKDISTTDETHEDWGVFGLGYIGGPSCVVSDLRLKKTAKNKSHLQERLIKVVLHELGHTLGLQHCDKDPKCLMEAANGSIASVDREEKYLCSFCKNKIHLR